MSAATKQELVESVNQVRLVGRISQQPVERLLPSGDSVWTFRVVVPRPRVRDGRQAVDAIECAVWRGRVRRSVSGWAADDVVEVSGSLRRRFFDTGRGSVSKVEIDVTGGRVIRRARSG